MANNLYKIRKKKNLSLRDLAFKSGVSFSHLSKIENCTIDPTQSIMCKIAKALNLEIQDIFTCD